MSRKHGGGDDAHIIDGTVVAVGLHLLDFVDHIHAFKHTAIDGVGAVEVGCATLAHIDFAHFRSEVGRIVGGEFLCLFQKQRIKTERREKYGNSGKYFNK